MRLEVPFFVGKSMRLFADGNVSMFNYIKCSLKVVFFKYNFSFDGQILLLLTVSDISAC